MAERAPVPAPLSTDAGERAACLDMARALADGLCGKARWRGSACSWDLPADGAVGAGSAEMDGRVGDGTAGVALFLLRTYRATRSEVHLQTACGALSHSLAGEHARGSAPGYYAGTAGVAAACAELGAVSEDGAWLERAESAAQPRAVGRVVVCGAS